MPVKETTTRRTASSKDGGTPVVTEETKTNRSRSGKSGPGDIAKSAKDTAKQAQNLAGEASEFVGSFADAAVNFLGGVSITTPEFSVTLWLTFCPVDNTRWICMLLRCK